MHEMNAEQLEARLAELTEETSVERRDALDNDALETRISEMEQIKAELESRKQAAAEEARKAEEMANKTGSPVLNESEEKRMELNSMEYRSLWLRNLQGNLNEEEKRAYASTDANNAVPTLVADKFFEKMKKLAPMLSEITLFRVAGNLKFVAEGTRNTAVKHTENAALAASADTIAQVVLGGFEFMKVIQISRTTKLMSVDAFEGWLVDMLGGDIARAIDNYILNDASNGIAAITYTTGTNQILNTATTGYTYDDIVDLAALLPAAYDAEAKFITNKKTLAKIRKIKDSTGDPLFYPDTATGMGGNMLGYPVVVDDYVTTANDALYLGRWTDVVGNLSEEPHVDADESAGFTANAIMYRGIAVFDSKPAKTDGIVRLVSTTA